MMARIVFAVVAFPNLACALFFTGYIAANGFELLPAVALATNLIGIGIAYAAVLCLQDAAADRVGGDASRPPKECHIAHDRKALNR